MAIRIISPTAAAAPYCKAAEVFQTLYEQVTGTRACRRIAEEISRRYPQGKLLPAAGAVEALETVWQLPSKGAEL